MLRYQHLAAAIVALLLLPQAVLLAASDIKVVVILDNSGSMNQAMRAGASRLDVAKQSLLRVLDQVPPEAEIGVLLLNPIRGERWLLPLGPVNKAATRQAISGLTANGGTPLGATMKIAGDALLQLRGQQRYGTYKLLIVTDGEAGDGHLVERFLPRIQARGLLVDVIGVAMSQNHSLATRTSTYRNANDSASLEKAISAVVLGESTADDSAAAESDFELLSGLPTEIATASIAALTTLSSDPLANNASPDWQPQFANQPGPNAAPRPPGNNQPKKFSFATLVVLGVVMIMVFRLVAAIGKHR